MREEQNKLYLKKIGINDLNNKVISWFKDKELMKYYTNSKKEITREELEKSILKGKELQNSFTYGIFNKQDNTLIGTIKIGPINIIHKTSDLVVLIGDKEFLGKGLSIEAIKLGNLLAFNEYGIRKLYGGMYKSNIPSIKAYIRAGWLIEGVLKGQYIVEGKNEDRILVAHFNKKFFKEKELEEVHKNHKKFLKEIGL